MPTALPRLALCAAAAAATQPNSSVASAVLNLTLKIIVGMYGMIDLLTLKVMLLA